MQFLAGEEDDVGKNRTESKKSPSRPTRALSGNTTRTTPKTMTVQQVRISDQLLLL